MRRVLVALVAFLILAPAASAAARPRLSAASAQAIFLRHSKVADWLGHYPRSTWVPGASYDPGSHTWTAYVSTPKAGFVADGTVDDATGRVTSAWTGPQVNWNLARGGRFRSMIAGRWLSSWPVWLGFCAVFLVGLADLRRPLALRNLDLLALLSFTVSLAYLDAGRIFTSVPLAYPPLLYLLGRCAWIGLRGRPPRAARPVWPVWLLTAATLALVGVRVGLVAADSQVTDVGYASLLGAERIATGQSLYGNFPVQGPECGTPDKNGIPLGRIQPSGRCEIPVAGGDTYGPVAYETYVPAYWALGFSGGQWTWSQLRTGDWSNVPAAHLTAVVLDLACIGLLALIGWKLAGRRLAVTLAFAWAAFPFTQYVASASTNDALVPVFLLAGLASVAVPWARGASVALSGWTKFASLLLVPLWASYPEGLRRPRAKIEFAVAFLVVTELAFSILLFAPHDFHTVAVVWHHSIGLQLGRASPFSIWDWRQYHAGLLDLHWLQRPLAALVAVGAIALYFVPRRKSFLQLTALTGAVLIAFEIVLVYWFYLYIVWFFPFVVLALLACAEPSTRSSSSTSPSSSTSISAPRT